MSLSALLDLPAPAKLNLFLHVVGRRDDGYHLLQSVFVLLDWCDVLHVERRSDGQLSRQDLGPELPADDLCLRAARALQQASGSALGAHIAIDKQVPWGAGLGGGSSDAATTLLALNRLWGLNWPRHRLQQLAVRLGADVPFFVGGHNAWVEGIGEQLTPVAVPPASFALLKPSVAVPTAAIFGSPDLPRHTAPAIVADFLADPFGFGRNDLQTVASRYAPVGDVAKAGAGDIDQALSMLLQAFGNSRMTGSGSTVFAHAGNGQLGSGMGESADRLARLLATAPQDWTARLCCSLDVHPLVGWASD